MLTKELVFIVQMFAGLLTNTLHSPLGSFCLLSPYVGRLTRVVVELIRCRLQAQHNHCRPKTWSEIRHSVSALVRHGGLRSLYRVPSAQHCAQSLYTNSLQGASLTILREMPANFLYFATFEYLVRSLQSGSDTRVHQVPSYAIAIAGGIAGIGVCLCISRRPR